MGVLRNLAQIRPASGPLILRSLVYGLLSFSSLHHLCLVLFLREKLAMLPRPGLNNSLSSCFPLLNAGIEGVHTPPRHFLLLCCIPWGPSWDTVNSDRSSFSLVNEKRDPKNRFRGWRPSGHLGMLMDTSIFGGKDRGVTYSSPSNLVRQCHLQVILLRFPYPIGEPI